MNDKDKSEIENEGVTATLLLSCRDRKGIVAEVADFIYRYNGNIVHADQHTDKTQSVFLQRVEWELQGFLIAREEFADAFRPLARKFDLEWRLHFSDEVPRVAVFVSRQAHCMYDLFARRRMGEFQAEFPLVISNHEDLRSASEQFGATFHCYPIGPETKTAQELRILQKLEEERIDLVVLARYMQIVGEDLVKQYEHRMINIHHSFLPAFMGAKPYHQAYERGVKLIGATAHYVTETLDQGPIIEQNVARVSHRDSVENIVLIGRDLEKVVLSRAVGLHLAHRIIVYGNKTIVFG